MSTASRPDLPGEHAEPQGRRALSGRTKAIAGVLLAIPLLALALVPLYSRATPELIGIPFFYWYQLMWVLLTPLFTWAAYLLICRERDEAP